MLNISNYKEFEFRKTVTTTASITSTFIYDPSKTHSDWSDVAKMRVFRKFAGAVTEAEKQLPELVSKPETCDLYGFRYNAGKTLTFDFVSGGKKLFGLQIADKNDLQLFLCQAMETKSTEDLISAITARATEALTTETLITAVKEEKKLRETLQSAFETLAKASEKVAKDCGMKPDKVIYARLYIRERGKRSVTVNMELVGPADRPIESQPLSIRDQISPKLVESLLRQAKEVRDKYDSKFAVAFRNDVAHDEMDNEPFFDEN